MLTSVLESKLCKKQKMQKREINCPENVAKREINCNNKLSEREIN